MSKGSKDGHGQGQGHAYGHNKGSGGGGGGGKGKGGLFAFLGGCFRWRKGHPGKHKGHKCMLSNLLHLALSVLKFAKFSNYLQMIPLSMHLPLHHWRHII